MNMRVFVAIDYLDIFFIIFYHLTNINKNKTVSLFFLSHLVFRMNFYTTYGLYGVGSMHYLNRHRKLILSRYVPYER